MLSSKIKKELSDLIQDFLQEVDDPELPKGEVEFLLHIDGVGYSSWANIRNESQKHRPAPQILIRNTQFNRGV